MKFYMKARRCPMPANRGFISFVVPTRGMGVGVFLEVLS